MKAIVKFTSEEIEVTRGETINGVTYYYHIQSNGHFIRFTENQLEFPKPTTTQPPIDWEQRHYEIVKHCINGILGNDEMVSLAKDAGLKKNCRDIPSNISEMAVVFADALIAELKKGAEK